MYTWKHKVFMKSKRLKLSVLKPPDRVVFVVAVGLVGVVTAMGVVLSLSLRADTVGTVSFQAEAGTKSGNIAQVADAQAAGGSAVQFGQVTSAPTGGFCDSFPALPSSKPDATNTGVPAGTTLTNYTGPTTVTTAGTVIDGKIITAQLNVNANNVTVKNSKLGPGGYWAVKVGDGVTGTKILNSDIYAPNGAYTGIGISDGVVCGNHIRGYENSITIGGNMTIQANYIHAMKGDGSTTPHYDGIEVYSGSNSKIWGNNIMVNDPNNNWLGDTGAINITAEWSSINNVDVNGNWLGGGSYTLYVRKSSGGGGFTYSNIKVTNNRWYGSAPKGFAAFGPMSDDGGSITTTGNVWDTSGQPL